MITRMSKGWKWFDMIAFFFVVIVICAIITVVAPSSGLAHALHQGFHFLALLVGWLASGLAALAQLLNQL